MGKPEARRVVSKAEALAPARVDPAGLGVWALRRKEAGDARRAASRGTPV